MRRLLLLAFIISGCATSQKFAQKESAAHVGCRPSDILISEVETGLVNSSWVAECKKQKYYCSRTPDSDSSFKVKCSPLK